MMYWVLLKRRCSFVLRIVLIMMVIGRNVTAVTGSSFWHRIYYIRILFYKCLSGCFQQISTLHRSSYNSLVNLVSNPLPFMLKHWLRHIRNGNVWSLWSFIWINRSSLPFFFYWPHCVWGYRPGSCKCIRVFREGSHCIPYYPSLYTFMNLIFEILIWPLRSLSITNKPIFESRVLSTRNLLVIICKSEILLLYKIVSGNSWWSSLVFKVSPLVLF